LKMQLAAKESSKSQVPSSKGKPALALIAFVPLAWLLLVTMTAGVQKIWHPSPKIGFLAQVAALKEKLPTLEQTAAAKATPALQKYSDLTFGELKTIVVPLQKQLEELRSNASADSQVRLFLAENGPLLDLYEARKAIADNKTQHFNNLLDAAVAGSFLILISTVFLMSLREWILLLARKKAADLRETPPTWLPDYALAQAKPLSGVALLALAFALVKELSGEADLDRARQAHTCACAEKSDVKIYTEVTEARFKGVRRCC